MVELFPGILNELVADGAPVWDDGELSQFCFSFGGHLLVRSLGLQNVDAQHWRAHYNHHMSM
jgi:hypothetical protein